MKDEALSPLLALAISMAYEIRVDNKTSENIYLVIMLTIREPHKLVNQ